MLTSPRLLPLGLAAAALVFLLAVQLLGSVTNAAAPFLEQLFVRVLLVVPLALVLLPLTVG